jgi:ABC-type nitrate/sulfonate/bicarbonate transport system ATPase subunit
MTTLPQGIALDVRIRVKHYPAPGSQPPLAVLREIEFHCTPASFTTITGPSGIGKSTLLNLIAGLDTEFDGLVRIPPSTRLAYVFQEPRLLPWRTVRQNVELALQGSGRPSDPRWIDELLQATGLVEAADLHPTRLSLGMARRAGLVRAFALEPDLLLMDEPFVSLDEPTADRLRDLLAELLRRRPATVLFVTHNLREALRLGDRLLALAGRPASLVADLPLDLPLAQRRDRVALELAARDIETRLGELITVPG